MLYNDQVKVERCSQLYIKYLYFWLPLGAWNRQCYFIVSLPGTAIYLPVSKTLLQIDAVFNIVGDRMRNRLMRNLLKIINLTVYNIKQNFADLKKFYPSHSGGPVDSGKTVLQSRIQNGQMFNNLPCIIISKISAAVNPRIENFHISYPPKNVIRYTAVIP